MTENYYTRRTDELTKRYESRLGDLADARLAQLRRDWKAEQPGTLKIGFGMGAEWIEIDGKPVHDQDKAPQLVRDALADVLYICDGYTRACPGDIAAP